MRAPRLHDENAIAAGQIAAKSIHQRNKSTPALLTISQIGPLRGGIATKRTAFADVSNTQRLQPAKDDSAIDGKVAVSCEDAKAALSHVSKLVVKNNALSKPAQRPLAVKATSQLPAPNTQTTTSTVPIKATADTVKTQSVTARTIVSKKSTTVLKEPGTQPPAREENEQSDKPFATEDLLAQLKESSSQSSSSSAIDGVILPAAQARVVAPLAIHPSTELVQQQVVLPHLSAYQHPHITASSQPEQQVLLALEQHAQALENERNVALVLKQLQSQPYTEEEEEDMYYDDGYSTTRSLKLRGETTGGATIVLQPKYTTKVNAEIAAAKEMVEQARTPEEMEDEQWDTSMVAEYGDEIFEYMHTLENRMRPNPNYMDHQTECQWSMRAVLMDWLVQVHARFQLLPETLFLSVNYIDRFLSCKVVSLAKLQLVGATAIFLASKYEEVNCPSISEVVYMVDNGYSQEEILKAERFMLSMLAFELGWPGPMSFLRRISKADDYDLETRTLAKYFLEVTIMDERFVGCAPSFLAAGAHCLARLMLRKGDWTPAHVFYSNYTYSQLRQLLGVMVECCEDPHKHHHAVFDKYQDKRYKRASLFVQGEMQNGFQLPGTSRVSSSGWFDNTQGWRRPT